MVIIADKHDRKDAAYDTLVKFIDCKFPIVMVNWVDGFVFNDALLKIKNYVLVCYSEYGWNYKITESHIWGVNKDLSGRYIGEEWDRFNKWVKENPPKIIFKRELLKKDVTERVKPIDYPCTIPAYPMQLEDDFNSRSVNVFNFWGRSNECRIRLQGEIWLHGFKKGFQVCDNVYYVNDYLKQESGEKWVTLWIPHWARVDMHELMKMNNLSKLSVSLPGAGFKCFRTAESPINSVMVMHKNDFAWAYDWNETNCILVEPGKEIEGIEAALKNKNLCNIYIEGVKTVDKYRVDNYIKNYIEPLVKDL